MIHLFTDIDNSDGAFPRAGLTLVGSTLYGTTTSGGNFGNGTVFSIADDGTNYKTVHSFAQDEGEDSFAPLTLVGSVLYGANYIGGPGIYGTLFSLDTDGSDFQVIHAFSNPAAGFPDAGLTAVGSTLIGTTSNGNATLFSFQDSVNYTAGGPAVAPLGNLGVTIASDDTDLTSASVTISAATLQSGDKLSFTNTPQITGSYNSGSGTLTLTGTATAAQYQAALQSITFSSASTSLTNRQVSVVTYDDNNTQSSNTTWESVNVSAPAEVSALYVKGTSWSSGFDNYLADSGLGNSATPALGYALQTGASQSKTLPWVNVNVIEATFSQPVNVTQNSLILSGGSGGSTPSVTGFSQLSPTTYAWTLSSAVTANRLEISFRSTGTNAVTDTNGAGLSGNWTNGASAFPSGNGLAGTTSSSDFNFLFNALPGDALRGGTVVNSTDYLDVRAKNNTTYTSTNYNPYYDVTGAGIINSTDYLDVRARNNNTLPANAPGPQDSGVGSLGSDDGADVSGAMLAVQEGSTSQTGATPATAGSNQTSGGNPNASGGNSTNISGGASSGSAAVSPPSSSSDADATDEAISDFDLADLWV